MKVVGVDPGGRDTGVVLRSRGDVEYVDIVHLPDRFARPTPAYLNAVLDAVAAAELAGSSPTGRRPIVAVEGLNAPSWYIDGEAKPLDPEHVIGVAMVLAVVIAVFPRAVEVAPKKHGQRRLGLYPRAIVGGPHNERWRRAEPKGKGVLRHARAAFDIAQAGLVEARRQQRRTT